MARFPLAVSCLSASAFVVAAALSPAAAAGTLTQIRDFDFGLFDSQSDGVAVPKSVLDGDWDRVFAGAQSLKFEQFGRTDARLDSVSLQVSTRFEGFVETFEIPAFNPDLTRSLARAGDPSGFVAADGPASDIEQIGFASAATAGPLRAEAAFEPYEAGVDGFLLPDGIRVDQSGAGAAATTEASDLAFFLGDNAFNTRVAACLMVEYFGAAGGEARSLGASGSVELVYGYTTLEPVDPVTPNVVPSPAALPAGLALLGSLLLRRKRA